ncbi:MAG: hypothetical protein ABWZ29_07825 [Casimicrobiaceae bacterium]
MTTAPTALCRRLVAAGKRAEAELVVADLVARQFDVAVRSASINADWTSLNSLNGTVDTEDGRRYFFKFHQEEDEEATVREYYRAEILQRAGLPVDMPAMISRQPGHQVLLSRSGAIARWPISVWKWNAGATHRTLQASTPCRTTGA